MRSSSVPANGTPTMRFNGGSIPYTPIGLEGWPRFGFEKNDRWQFSNDLTWVKGRHTAKGGIEYRHHTFPSRGWATNTGGAFNFATKSSSDAAIRLMALPIPRFG